MNYSFLNCDPTSKLWNDKSVHELYFFKSCSYTMELWNDTCVHELWSVLIVI